MIIPDVIFYIGSVLIFISGLLVGYNHAKTKYKEVEE